MNFGIKLKHFAKTKYGSVDGLAAQLGIASSSLSRYISGIVMPKLDFLQELLKLGCDMNWLLNEKISTDGDSDKIDPVALEMKRILDENLQLKAQIGKIASITEIADIIRQGKKK
jgi:transcriptional regulator with XRE-family HTH domain